MQVPQVNRTVWDSAVIEPQNFVSCLVTIHLQTFIAEYKPGPGNTREKCTILHDTFSEFMVVMEIKTHVTKTSMLTATDKVILTNTEEF